MVNTKRRALQQIALGTLLIAGSTLAFAQSGGEDNLIGGIKSGLKLIFYVKLLFLAAFYAGGLFYGGSGILSLIKSLKPNSQENVGQALGKFGLGVVLCILPTAIGLTASTFAGNGGADAQKGITTEGKDFDF